MPEFTLGLEAETPQVSPQAKRIIKQEGFTLGSDGSIKGLAPNPGEVRSGIIPVKYVEPFRIVNETFVYHKIIQLCECMGDVNKTCGIHVHIGRKEGWVSQVPQWMSFALAVEARMFSMVPKSRGLQNEFCMSIKDVYSRDELSQMAGEGMLGEVIGPKRYLQKRRCWMNFVEIYRPGGIRTVEIRLLGNTKRANYIMGWVRVWLRIAALMTSEMTASQLLFYAHGTGLDPEWDQLKTERDRGQRVNSALTTPPGEV